MRVVKNTSIREKYTEGLDRELKGVEQIVNEIVIHGTGGGASGDAMIKWMMGGERGREYARGIALYHYLVDYDGTVTEIIDPKKCVFHSSSGVHDIHTIGIEMMNKDPQNRNPYSDAQYKSLLALVIELLKANSKIVTIVGHGQNAKKYSSAYKQCPGPRFDWKKLADELTDFKYVYKMGEEKITDIDIT
jgi:hypothetical protein